MRNLLLAVSLLIGNQIIAATFSLQELYLTKQIEIKAIGKGGFTGEVLEVKVKNITTNPISGNIEPGTVFKCSDANAQNLIVLSNYPFLLKPAESQAILVYTNCIEPSDYAPHKEATFTLDQNPNEKLVGLARIIATNSAYKEYSQSLLWSLVRNEKTFTYTNEDSIKAWPIFNFLSSVAKVQKYKSPEPPKPKFLFSTRVNLVYSMDIDQKLTLLVTDNEGKTIKEYYRNKPISRGIYSVTLGHNDMVEDTTKKIIFKLLDENGNELIKRTVKNNTLEDRLKFWSLSSVLEYTVKEPITGALLQLFDPEGNLMSVLYQSKNLPAGARKTPISFFHSWGTKSVFTFKLFDNKKNLIQTFTLDGKNSLEVKNK